MGWSYLGIILAVCAVLSAVGFWKFVYFFFDRIRICHCRWRYHSADSGAL